jgi:hypothetical protein
LYKILWQKKKYAKTSLNKSKTKQNRQGGFTNMRNLRKLTAAVLAVALVLTSMTTVFAADSANVANADKAATLKDLGLYSGQDANDPKIGLENALTTQDSLIFLAKLFGYNEAANKLTADQVTEVLAKFDDAASISDYAKNVVAYSAANSILSGSTQNDKFFVGAKDTVTAARFATFMLRQMGYTVPDYRTSISQLAETKGSKVNATLTGDLTRDAAVGIMYGALTVEKASGKTVIADIVGDNVDLMAKAEKLGLIEPETISGQGSGSKSESSGGGSLDYTNPEVIYDPEIDERCFAISEKGRIFIIYSEAMNEAQMLDKGNYQVSIDGSDTYKNLGDDDTITKVNDRKVQIYVKELEDKNDSTITPYVKIAPIMDLAGNRLYGSVDSYTVEGIEPENVIIEDAQLIAMDKIKLVFNMKMASVDYKDIELTTYTETTTSSSIKILSCEPATVNSDGKTEVVLILDKDLSTDGRDEAGNEIFITTIDAPSSEAESGSKLRYYSINLCDKVSPEIVKWDHDNDVSTYDIAKVIAGGDLANPQIYGNDYTVPNNTTGNITIYYSEDINESELEGKFVVDGFEINNITAPAGTKTVILEVMANADNTPVKTTVTQVSEIYDTAYNAFVPGSTLSVMLEAHPTS